MNVFTPLTCLLVEDNEMNRLALQHLIELTPQLELVASFTNALDCLAFFRQGGQVDLVFLDIMMPQLTGLDLVRLLPEPPPAIILVTSHRDYAFDAFELRVTDYLEKPVDFPRFLKAVQRVAKLHSARQATSAEVAPAPQPALPTEAGHLFIKVNKKLVQIQLNDVFYIEAMSDYSVLVFEHQKLIVYSTLKRLEERLPPATFVRVHRSFIVNVPRIQGVEEHMIKFSKQHEVPIGKAYQESFYAFLNKL